MSERRLAAIAVLDVVGFTRLMADDEDGALAALQAHRNELDPILLNHGGRIVKGTGDGLLLEVPSAVEAVRAAIEVQELMADRNVALPVARRMDFRIGINLGDVIVEGDGDIYGDGVNVAARLEGLAPPGGICISESLREQVAGKVDCDFEDLGRVRVKNISRPIDAWLVKLAAVSPRSNSEPSTFSVPKLAILPFQNLSAEPEQDYFAEGITEDLIVALSHHEDLRVVSRSSVFALTSEKGDLRNIARKLDATHVLEGSVRRSGDRVRVTAQLVEAESDQQIWAGRFDRELDDIFVVQDEIVTDIGAHISPELERERASKITAADPDELDVWDLVLRGRQKVFANTPEHLAEGITLLETACERDPESAQNHATLAMAWTTIAFNRWPIDVWNPFEQLSRHATEAYRLDPTDPGVLAICAMVENYMGHQQKAEELSRRAVSFAPHMALPYVAAGQVGVFRGQGEKAIEELTVAWRLASHEPWRFHIATNLAFAHYLLGNYDASWAWAQRGLETAEYLQLRAIGAAALAKLGRADEARAQISHVIHNRPGATAESFLRNIGWEHKSDIEHYRDGLVSAGLSE